MKFRKTLLVMATLAPLLVLTACGTGNSPGNGAANSTTTGNQTTAAQGTADIGSNPPFTVRLNQEVVTPSKNFDPIPTQIAQATVVSWNGTAKTLDFSTPVLFVAYWCPHCQRTLTLLQQNWQSLRQPPSIVSAGYQPGTTLEQAKTLFAQEESALHFHFPVSKVYFLLNATENKQLVQAYPELYFTVNHSKETLIGEHVLTVWQRALS